MTDCLIFSALNYHYFIVLIKTIFIQGLRKNVVIWIENIFIRAKNEVPFFRLESIKLSQSKYEEVFLKFNLPFLYYYLLVLIPYLCVFRRSNDCSSNSGGSLHHHHGLISSKAFADSDDGMNAYGQSSPRSSGE